MSDDNIKKYGEVCFTLLNGTYIAGMDIPEGKYAKFIIFGNPERAVSEFWINFWEKFEKESYEIRNYTYDFEEYIDGDDYENMEIHIYIGIKYI